MHLLYLGSRGEVGIEIGLQAIGAHGPVARGHAQIDQPLALVAGHAVAALGVRAHDIHAIGHGNALHGTALAGHLSLQHIGTSFGVQVGQVFFGRGDARQIISLEGIPGIIGEVRRRERKGYGLAIIGQLENQVAGFFAAIEGELEGRGHRDLIGLPDIFHLVARNHLAPAVDAHKGHQCHHAAVVAEAQAGGVRVSGQVRIGLHDDVVQHLPGHFHSPSAVERIGSFLAIIEIIIRFPQSQDIFLGKEVVKEGFQLGDAVHIARKVVAEKHEAFRILHDGSVGKIAADKGSAVHFFPEDGHHPLLPDRRVAQTVLAGSLGILIVFLQAGMGIQVAHFRLGAGGVPAKGGIALLQAFQAGIHTQDYPRKIRCAGLDVRPVLPEGGILGIEPFSEGLVLGASQRGQEAGTTLQLGVHRLETTVEIFAGGGQQPSAVGLIEGCVDVGVHLLGKDVAGSVTGIGAQVHLLVSLRGHIGCGGGELGHIIDTISFRRGFANFIERHLGGGTQAGHQGGGQRTESPNNSLHRSRICRANIILRRQNASKSSQR